MAGTIPSKSYRKIHLLFCAHKYDICSLTYLFPYDIINLIINLMIQLKLEHYCRWSELKTSFFNKSAYSINNRSFTLVNNNVTSFAYTTFAKARFKPVWTIKKDSKDTSGYFQIACMCGNDKKKILDIILTVGNEKDSSFYAMPEGLLGIWAYQDFGFINEELQLTIDSFNKKFIINGKSFPFQYYDACWFKNNPELVCIVIMTNNKVPINSSATIVDFKYEDPKFLT